MDMTESDEMKAQRLDQEQQTMSLHKTSFNQREAGSGENGSGDTSAPINITN